VQPALTVCFFIDRLSMLSESIQGIPSLRMVRLEHNGLNKLLFCFVKFLAIALIVREA
jgi:hypothetical protein